MKRSDFIGPRTPLEQWRRSLKRWIVCSPESGRTIPVLDDGSGPTEYSRDVVEIDAANKRDALIFGLKMMRKIFPNGWHNSDPSENPFKGMTADEYPDDEDCETWNGFIIRDPIEQQRIDEEATY